MSLKWMTILAGLAIPASALSPTMPSGSVSPAPQCPPGATLTGNACRYVMPRQNICPTGYTVQVQCARDVPPKCPPGTALLGGKCVKNRPTNPPQNCPPGSVLRNGQCYHSGGGVCPPGTTFKFGRCMPADNRPSPSPESCPPGYSFDPIGQKCVNPWNQDRPAPTGSPVVCLGTQYFDGEKCVELSENSAARCPPGTTFDGQKCINPWIQGPPPATVSPVVCLGTQYFDGEKCVELSENSAARCPPGTTFDGGKCTTQFRPSCPPGTVFNGKSCSAPGDEIVACIGTQYFDGEKCVERPGSSGPVSCPPGTVYDGGECTTQFKPSCPPGTVFNGKSCSPPGDEIVACIGTQYFDGEKCVDIPGTSSPVSCPPGHFFDGKSCVM